MLYTKYLDQKYILGNVTPFHSFLHPKVIRMWFWSLFSLNKKTTIAPNSWNKTRNYSLNWILAKNIDFFPITTFWDWTLICEIIICSFIWFPLFRQSAVDTFYILHFIQTNHERRRLIFKKIQVFVSGSIFYNPLTRLVRSTLCCLLSFLLQEVIKGFFHLCYLS